MNKYFRIGWNWVKASLLNGWKLIHAVTFSGNHDFTSAIASLKQHEQRLYELEFKILTHSYSIS
ncbi:MAG: hypothetical protein AAGF83_03690 [Cyanobacteria bacterium P01_G01_bin.67]